MILILHILIALASLVFTGILFLYPSKTKLNISYGLVVLTVFTGFYLILSKPAHMTQTCIEGLVYLAVVSYGIWAARSKLSNI